MDKTEIIKKLKKIIQNTDTNKIIGLSGDPGAGKTDLVKSLVAELCGSFVPVTSPTFTYQNIYTCSSLTVRHFDLYRVQDSLHLDNIGFWEAVRQNTGVVLCEWPDIFDEVMNALDIHIIIWFDGTARDYELYTPTVS